MVKESQTFIVARAKEILSLSEAHLVKVLRGETKLPERVVTQVALELYKKRIPQNVEANTGNNSITMIKIVKNHLPGKMENESEVLDVTPARHDLAQTVEDKIAEINAKIKDKQGRSMMMPAKEK